MNRVILLFPGQGSQSVGMGRAWYAGFPEFRQAICEASDAIHCDVRALCLEEESERLWLTQFTQPAILSVSYGILSVLRARLGLQCELVAGHSLGEYSALVSLGALRFADAVRTVHERGLAMSSALAPGLGGMLVYLGTKHAELRALCQELSHPQGVVEIANYNSPRQLVLTGHSDALARAAQQIAERELGSTVPLPLSGAFHSSLMRPVAEHLEGYLAGVELSPFAGRIAANLDAELHDCASYTRALLAEQVVRGVLWTRSLERLAQAGPGALWIEVGPGNTLTKLLRPNLGPQDAYATHTPDCLATLDAHLTQRAAA